MTLGQADYHLSKPWTLEQDLYREISAFLADWAKDQESGFELFHIVGRLRSAERREPAAGRRRRPGMSGGPRHPRRYSS